MNVSTAFFLAAIVVLVALAVAFIHAALVATVLVLAEALLVGCYLDAKRDESEAR